jgi:hypothetical protein
MARAFAIAVRMCDFAASISDSHPQRRASHICDAPMQVGASPPASPVEKLQRGKFQQSSRADRSIMGSAQDLRVR